MTNAWKEPLVGAQPRRPRHWVSVEIPNTGGQRVPRHQLRVVGDDAGPSRRTDPVPLVRAQARVDFVQQFARQPLQTPRGRQGTQRAGVLGEEDVGGRAVAFLQDDRRQLGGVAVAGDDANACFPGESLEDGSDQLLAAAGVNDQLRSLLCRYDRRCESENGQEHETQGENG